VTQRQELGEAEASRAWDWQLMQEEAEAAEQVRQEESHSWHWAEFVSVKAFELHTQELGVAPLKCALEKQAVHEELRFPTEHVKQVA